ncbi:MAG: GntR family transcriptional regulator [Carbonactinosporaceae bacterium]
MTARFDVNSPVPLYVQVADHVESLVASGRLQPGARLPAERHFAEELGVSYVTVRKAVEVLRERGVVATSHGKGSFVVGP